MLDSLLSILSLTAIGLASYGLGRPLLRALRVAEADRLEAGVWSVAVGLIVAGTVLAALGLVGLLYSPLVAVLSVAACVGAVAQIVSDCARGGRKGAGQKVTGAICVEGRADASHKTKGLMPRGSGLEARRNEPPAPRPSPLVPGPWPFPPLGLRRPGGLEPGLVAPWPAPGRWIARGVIALAVLTCAASLVTALAPPTAGDALCYHLELPKTFLADRSITYLPYSENSTYPLLVEMWYLWGLALDGGVAAQLVHWGLGILLGLATVTLATPLVGRSWAWIAGATVVLVPGVNNQMTAPLNDVALAAFTTLATAAWWRAVVGGRSRRWLVLAGLAAGGALGTKYVALVFAAAGATASLWVFCRQPSRRRLIVQGAAVVAVVATSVSGLWYVRAAWYRGNPVYPFLSELVPGTDSEASEAHQTLPESKSPLGRDLWATLAAGWHVTMHPERFGGRGHQLGVLFLAAVPGVLFARRLRGLGTLLTGGLAYCVLWCLLRQNVRFLLPAVPLLSVVVVWIWIEMRRFPRLPRLVAGTTFAGVLAAYAAIPLARCRDELPVALGLETRADYLERCEPTWQAAEVANRLFGPHAHLLSQDYRAFYFQCRVTRENVYRRYTHYDRAIAGAADFSRVMQKGGFTLLLLAENVASRGIQYDSTLSRLVDAARPLDGAFRCPTDGSAGRDHSLVTLTEYAFQDADGGVRRYRLVMLGSPPVRRIDKAREPSSGGQVGRPVRSGRTDSAGRATAWTASRGLLE